MISLELLNQLKHIHLMDGYKTLPPYQKPNRQHKKQNNMKDVNNYVSYPISVFDDSNTLYMQKQVNGFTYTFLLKFISFNGYMIEGEILEIQPNNIKSLRIKSDIYQIGSNIKCPIKKCYLFSNSCRWFAKSNSDWHAI